VLRLDASLFYQHYCLRSTVNICRRDKITDKRVIEKKVASSLCWCWTGQGSGTGYLEEKSEIDLDAHWEEMMTTLPKNKTAVEEGDQITRGRDLEKEMRTTGFQVQLEEDGGGNIIQTCLWWYMWLVQLWYTIQHTTQIEKFVTSISKVRKNSQKFDGQRTSGFGLIDHSCLL